jgi:hypothetical protein
MYINYTCDEALLGADIERGPRSWLHLRALLAEGAVMGQTDGAEEVRENECILSSAVVVWRRIGGLVGVFSGGLTGSGKILLMSTD